MRVGCKRRIERFTALVQCIAYLAEIAPESSGLGLVTKLIQGLLKDYLYLFRGLVAMLTLKTAQTTRYYQSEF